MNYFNFCSIVMIILALLFYIFRALEYKRKLRNGLDEVDSINGIQVRRSKLYVQANICIQIFKRRNCYGDQNLAVLFL